MRRLLAVLVDKFLSLLLFAVKVSAGLALVFVFPVFCVYWANLDRDLHPTVKVLDEAGVLFGKPPLAKEIEKLTFDKRVHIVVLTMPGRLSGSLDDAVLDYAHQQHNRPLLHSPTLYPERLRDGFVILAVSPEGRKVGCYFGEDVKLSLDAQKDIQDAAKDQFRRSDWRGGILSMAKEYANAAKTNVLITVGQFALAGAVSIGGVVWLFLYFRSGLRAAVNARIGRGHYSRALRSYDAIVRRADSIPEDSSYGSLTKDRYRAFSKEYAGFPRIVEDFVGGFSGPDWFRKRAAPSAKAFRKRAFALESRGEAIVRAVELLNMSPRWEDVWVKEVGLIKKDLERLPRLGRSIWKSLLSVLPPVRIRRVEDAEKLGVWVSFRLFKLDALSSKLEAGEIETSDALKELDKITSEIQRKAEALVRKKRFCRRFRKADGLKDSDDPYMTIRPAFDVPLPWPSNVGKTPLTFALLLGTIWIIVLRVLKSAFEDFGSSSSDGNSGGGSGGSSSGSSSSF